MISGDRFCPKLIAVTLIVRAGTMQLLQRCPDDNKLFCCQPALQVGKQFSFFKTNMVIEPGCGQFQLFCISCMQANVIYQLFDFPVFTYRSLAIRVVAFNKKYCFLGMKVLKEMLIPEIQYVLPDTLIAYFMPEPLPDLPAKKQAKMMIPR